MSKHETPKAAPLLPPEVEAFIYGQADKAAEAKAKSSPPKRRGIAKQVWDDVDAGRVPARLSFPTSNYWSQKHADALHELAEAGDLAGLEAYEIAGTNTYAKALRTYRDASIHLLKEGKTNG